MRSGRLKLLLRTAMKELYIISSADAFIGCHSLLSLLCARLLTLLTTVARLFFVDLCNHIHGFAQNLASVQPQICCWKRFPADIIIAGR